MKCVAPVRQLIEQNTAVVLLYKFMTDIHRVCSRTLVIHDGKVQFDGDVKNQPLQPINQPAWSGIHRGARVTRRLV